MPLEAFQHIEVNPICFDAPHPRSSLPHPKTDFFSRNQFESRYIIPWLEYKNTSLFETRLAFRRFRAKTPRRSTIIIGVHLIFFAEARHVGSSIPHPKTGFRKKSNCILSNNPMARVYKTAIYLSKEDWHSDEFRHSEDISAKMLYIYLS